LITGEQIKVDLSDMVYNRVRRYQCGV